MTRRPGQPDRDGYVRPARLERDVRNLDAYQRESWAERACIMEFDGTMERFEAEMRALEAVRRAKREGRP